ncbi:hypothetical protein B0H17DRAFT_1078211, partial [Mycena rosella]
MVRLRSLSFLPSLLPHSLFLLPPSCFFLLRPLDECSVADPVTKGSAAAAGGMPGRPGHAGGGGLRASRSTASCARASS